MKIPFLFWPHPEILTESVIFDSDSFCRCTCMFFKMIHSAFHWKSGVSNLQSRHNQNKNYSWWIGTAIKNCQPHHCNVPESNIPPPFREKIALQSFWQFVVLVESYTTIKPPVIQKFKFHFDKLKEMIEVNTTKTVREVMDQVIFCDISDDKVYLLFWMLKQGFYLIYCQENEYETRGDTSGSGILK